MFIPTDYKELTDSDKPNRELQALLHKFDLYNTFTEYTVGGFITTQG